ncbi:ATP-binding protein [Chitinophaga filiformis]|uniref:AAA family ATPase n=1 Tax=Chitinophaga filiformis TaxID=104663 RepID=UPI001F3B783E|nr:AAA family ATPase [Chitinophaga filiformis]MCF6406064.1 ATP-binding protein [Chitinophaga filiformis]
MLDKIRIRNFKSIDDLSIDLGRFNVFIGENGCGKSNILESIVYTSAAFNKNIENEFLALRGARTSAPLLMRSGFDKEMLSKDILIDINVKDHKYSFSFQNDNQAFSKWKASLLLDDNTLIKDINPISETHDLEPLSKLKEEVLGDLETLQKQIPGSEDEKLTNKQLSNNLQSILKRINDQIIRVKTELTHSLTNRLFKSLDDEAGLLNYMIYSPENFFLRRFEYENSYVEPLGHRGEGLLNLIKIIKKGKSDQYTSIIKNLFLIDWFSSFDIKEESSLGEIEFSIDDKYLEDGLKSFDIRNANEGFFFILFYVTLFTSDYTPPFFAIDNIDTALNPKLCSKLISVLSELAAQNNKQVIITTHNPSVLDGLNLNNDEERLFVVSRNAVGNTRVKRIEKKAPLEGEQPVKLSEQFLRGYIGGLPKNF